MEIKDYIVSKDASLSYTLALMNDFENHAVKDLEFRKFVYKNFNYRNPFRQVYDYVRNNFKYEEDYPDELIIYPMRLVKLKRGDCDDFSLFIKSVLHVLGFSPKYVLLGKNGNGFSHIAVICNSYFIDATNNVFNQYPAGYYNLKYL